MTTDYVKDDNAVTPEYLKGDAKDNKEILTKFEINCDMGEGFGPWKMGPDEEIMPLIDRVNCACGGHAGSPNIMLKTVKLAKKHGKAIGAHPGLPDKEGFGRRCWDISPDDIYTMVLAQVGALKAICDSENVPMSHIKPHGELYFYIERDEAVREAVIKACKVFGLPLVAAKSTQYNNVARKMGQQLIQEVYPDLHYSPEGKLVKITAGPKAARTPEIIYDCVKRAGETDQILSTEDKLLNLNFGDSPMSFCLHSDMPAALDNIKMCRKAVDEVNQKLGLI